MAAGTSWTTAGGGDWEICNDHGFVYKRRRRDGDAEDPGPPSPPVDPDAELRRNHRLRRRQCLLNLKDKYTRELKQWESLSATLLNLTDPHPAAGATSAGGGGAGVAQEPQMVLGEARLKLIDDLVAQAEAQEAVMNKVSDLCDYVEAECKAREETMVKALIDLPVWGSPRALMASLMERRVL